MKPKTKTVLFLIVGLLLLAGCLFLVFWGINRNPAPPESEHLEHSLDRPFTATATIRLDGTTLVADLNRSAENAFTLQIDEPQALQGLTFQYDGSNITASYHGMEVTIGDDSLIAQALAGILFRSIQEATAGSNVEISQEDGALTVQGSGEDGEFSLRIDPQRHTLLSLEVPSLDLSCEFSDFLFQSESSEPAGS